MFSLEGKPHAPLITAHEAAKAEMLANTSKEWSNITLLQYLENHPHEQLITMHDKAKAELLRN